METRKPCWPYLARGHAGHPVFFPGWRGKTWRTGSVKVSQLTDKYGLNITAIHVFVVQIFFLNKNIYYQTVFFFSFKDQCFSAD